MPDNLLPGFFVWYNSYTQEPSLPLVKGTRGTQRHTIKNGWYRMQGEDRTCGASVEHGRGVGASRQRTHPADDWHGSCLLMSILNQTQFRGPFEYHRPGRTYKKRPRFRIKRTAAGYVWLSKKKRVLTKPAATKSEAKKRAKIKLKAIKQAKRTRRKKF
jgi:hypothetical protein